MPAAGQPHLAWSCADARCETTTTACFAHVHHALLSPSCVALCLIHWFQEIFILTLWIYSSFPPCSTLFPHALPRLRLRVLGHIHYHAVDLFQLAIVICPPTTVRSPKLAAWRFPSHSVPCRLFFTRTVFVFCACQCWAPRSCLVSWHAPCVLCLILSRPLQWQTAYSAGGGVKGTVVACHISNNSSLPF